MIAVWCCEEEVVKLASHKLVYLVLFAICCWGHGIILAVLYKKKKNPVDFDVELLERVTEIWHKYFRNDLKIPKGQRLKMKALKISVYYFPFLWLPSVNWSPLCSYHHSLRFSLNKSMHEFFNNLPRLDLDCSLIRVPKKKGSVAVANWATS